MIVTLTFKVDSDAFAAEYDTEGLNASQVRSIVTEVIDTVVREDPRTEYFVLPGLVEKSKSRRR